MPNIGPLELVALLVFLALLIGAVFVIVLIVRAILRALNGGSAARIRELEGRVRDLENKR